MPSMHNAAMQPDLKDLIPCIVSGGQTGADRAALDWAIRNDVPHGGWCPRGRKAEDGPLDVKYLLQETRSSGYLQRTRQNVVDSDGTLVVNLGKLEGGTLATVKLAASLGKPYLVLQLDSGVGDAESRQVLDWVARESLAILNIAGPRASKRPDIYSRTSALLLGIDSPIASRSRRLAIPLTTVPTPVPSKVDCLPPWHESAIVRRQINATNQATGRQRK